MKLETGPSQPGDGKEKLRLWLRFLKTSRMIEAQIRTNLKREFNTTLPRFDVMVALSRHMDGLKMSQISDVLRVSNGNVTGIVDRLTSEGLVERTAVEGDRRALRVCLTQRGLQEFERQAAAHKCWIDELLQDVSTADAEHLEEHLLGFIQGMEARQAR
ncbi:MarR family transcriptional regulator [uncultured Ruegeria sp.]|uniref:MarR family winged helix-turn-helix transcriptional regulator n=1 Tax=uncultured Ruegeria sp. TaxID=259304 RepID=UPI002615EFDA|nr:MarR family transcriptional regulator [uncultured Ruegeria sp.]